MGERGEQKEGGASRGKSPESGRESSREALRERAGSLHRELDVMEAEMTAESYSGEMDADEAAQFLEHRMAEMQSRSATFAAAEIGLLQEVAAAEEGEARKKAEERVARRIRVQEDVARTALLTVATGEKVNLAVPESREQWGRVERILQEKGKNDETSQQRSGRIADRLVQMGLVTGDRRVIRLGVENYEVQVKRGRLLGATARNRAILAAVRKVSSANAGEAVARIIEQEIEREIEKSGDPVLKQLWVEYQQARSLAGVADIIVPPPELRAVIGDLPPPSFGALEAAGAAVSQTPGVSLRMGVNGMAEIRFGDGFSRKAAFVDDGEKTSLYILDENADRGVRGPIETEPAAISLALHAVLLDEHFTNAFRKFSIGVSEQDPTKAHDASIQNLVRVFLPPGEDTHAAALSVGEKQIVSNLAFLLSQPDAKHSSMEEKVRFLSEWQARMKSSGAGFVAAAEFLWSQDISREQISLAQFASRFA